MLTLQERTEMLKKKKRKSKKKARLGLAFFDIMVEYEI